MPGDEGYLTLTVRMRVSPEPEVVKLLKHYRDALNYAIKWIIEHSKRNGKSMEYHLYQQSIETYTRN